MLNINVITKNYLNWITGSGNNHIKYMNEVGIKVSTRPILVLTWFLSYNRVKNQKSIKLRKVRGKVQVYLYFCITWLMTVLIGLTQIYKYLWRIIRYSSAISGNHKYMQHSPAIVFYLLANACGLMLPTSHLYLFPFFLAYTRTNHHSANCLTTRTFNRSFINSYLEVLFIF